MRVFLDTNVLVSAFATRGICADILSVVLGEHQLVIGETVLGELRRVLETKMKMPAETIAEAEALLRREGVVSSTPAEVSVEIRDPDDVAVLGEAIQGAAEVVVTGDGDLLEISGGLTVEIVSPRGFWELLQDRQ